MARFAFRLQSVLALREDARRRRRDELAAACDALRQLDETRGSVAAQLEDQRCRDRPAERAKPARLRAAARYEAALRDRLAAIDVHRAAAQLDVERRQQALALAVGELRALEELRDRRRERFVAQHERREARLVDEAAALRHAAGGHSDLLL